MPQNTKNLLLKLNKDIFTISAVSFLIFFFIELIKPKFVIAYINLNYVLLICIITGILFVLGPETELKDQGCKKNNFGVLLSISLTTFIFILLFVRNLGIWGILVSLAGGIVAFLIGLTLNE